MLRLRREHLDEIRSHVSSVYPEEGCGLLVGRVVNGVREVGRIVPMKNVYNGSRRNRYSIDPLEYVKVENEASGRNEVVLGVYHSHPDYPAVPSNYDLEHAVPEFTYVIVSISGKEVRGISAWRLNDVLRQFEVEDMSIE
ncbi:MAG: M67 family metallopeptidase [Thaumarchaeota archaeon]|nr:M67 family metallopeptidase [Candidatus Calditenuaceae archaeon]MDW8042416.1 M67 family metallopeptidase [Nitrososphaerota archaeon]